MKRIVIKLGTGILTAPQGAALDQPQFIRICAEIARLIADGNQCVLVSSGAVTAGLEVLGLRERPTDLPGKQACASVGQPRLMREFDACFLRHRLHAAQLLLTHDDIDSRHRRANARTTLERLLASRSIIPVINENDSVAVEELNFGDNDRLSAEVALLAAAHLLVILTSSDGVLDNGVRIPVVTDIDAALGMVTPDKGVNSVGGMRAKLEAVRLAVSGGVETVIADGRRPDQLHAAVHGLDAGTRFPSASRAANPPSL
jgi:glutamate 5-kinase